MKTNESNLYDPQLNCRMSTRAVQTSTVLVLEPWFIVGFVDGEGSWGLSISKDSTRKLGYAIGPQFTIGVHACDLPLLKRIANQFGVGYISSGPNNLVRWQVSSIPDLVNVIIPFFDKYPLISQKQADFKPLQSNGRAYK